MACSKSLPENITFAYLSTFFSQYYMGKLKEREKLLAASFVTLPSNDLILSLIFLRFSSLVAFVVLIFAEVAYLSRMCSKY